jgi:hypothetical protein
MTLANLGRLASKIGQGILIAIILAYCLSPILPVVLHPREHQEDFHPYYYAAKAQAAGLNPYSATIRREVASPSERFPFLYPPQTLLIFRFFSLFSFRTAYYIFLVLKLLALVGLFYLWVKVFLRKEAGAWFYPFAFLALCSAIFNDINTGNLGVFEQLGLWLSFTFLLKKRLFPFCLMIFIVANFKIFPLFFLVLLLVIKQRKKYLYAAGTLAAYGLTQVAVSMTSPFYEDFLIRAHAMLQRFRDPSSYGLFWSILHGKTGGLRPHSSSFAHLALYLTFGAIVLFFSWRASAALQSLRKLKDEEKLRILVLLTCVAYCLLTPRFMPYTQIILIVPAWFALRKFLVGTEGVLFFILVAMQGTYKEFLPGMDKLAPFLWRYFPLILAFGVWLLFLRGIGRYKQQGRKAVAPLASAVRA